jgi:hypothetical protein
MVASCYSKAAEVNGKNTFGFSSQVEVDQAAMQAVIQYYSYNKEYDKVPGAIQYFVSIMINKFQHPDQSFIAFLSYTTNSYSYADIWWNIYTDDPNAPVSYTHPDYYNSLASDGVPGYHDQVGIETDWTYWNDLGTMMVQHIPKSTLDTADIASILGGFAGGVALASLVAASIITGGIAALVAAIVALCLATERVIIDYYIRAEKGDGWACAQAPMFGGCPPWYYEFGEYIKLGSICWLFVGYYYSPITLTQYFWVIPTFIGGQYLGYGGI